MNTSPFMLTEKDDELLGVSNRSDAMGVPGMVAGPLRERVVGGLAIHLTVSAGSDPSRVKPCGPVDDSRCLSRFPRCGRRGLAHRVVNFDGVGKATISDDSGISQEGEHVAEAESDKH